MAREMGVSRERTRAWEVDGCWPGRGKLAELLGHLGRVREERADPEVIAAWAEFGPDDSPPFDEHPRGPADAAAADRSAGDSDAEIVRFEELVEQLGRVAQERALEAATTGERIPEKFQELVRVALDVREGLRKKPAARRPPCALRQQTAA